MMTGFAIRNFKALANVPEQGEELLRLGALNVFVGPNGCGKSSMLQAIDFLRAFFRSSVEVYLREKGWDYHDLPNLRQSSRTIRWDLSAKLGPDQNGLGPGEYRYRVSLQPRRYLGIGEESLEFRPPAGEFQVLLHRKGRRYRLLDRASGNVRTFEEIGLPASVMSRLDASGDRRHYPELLRFRAWVEGFRSYLIWDPKVLRNPDRGAHAEIGPSGEHLAAVVGRLKDRNRPAFDRLVRRLKGLFPTLTDISVTGRGWGWRTVKLHEGRGNSTEVTFNSQQMGDGVLRLLAVTSLLYADQGPSVLTFEEPENGVHPQLLREVVQILRELTLRRPPNACQVFFSTHSPYVLDEFLDRPEEVYCMERRTPGAGAKVTRLSENRQLEIAREHFSQSLGEAWFSGLIGATAR